MKRFVILSLLVCLAFSAGLKSKLGSKQLSTTTAGKQDYIDIFNNCYDQACKAAEGSYTYGAIWNRVVTKCLASKFCGASTWKNTFTVISEYDTY
jgi:hypothetical protein